jgi:hypothetical protein
MLINQIKNSIETNTPLFIKSYMDYNVDWEDIVNLLSMSYNDLIDEEDEEHYRSISMMFNDKMKKFTSLKYGAHTGLSFHATDILSHRNLNSIDKLKYGQLVSVKEDLVEASGTSGVFVKLVVNMTKNTPTLVPHRDPHHVMLTQVLGSAKYMIYESHESDPYGALIDTSERKCTEYLMEKNDILFMPQGTIHSIDNSSIRAAFIFDAIKY